MAQMTLEYIVNNNLFSYHYLENLINKNPEWKMDCHLEVFQQIKKIYNRELAFIEGLNESQLEKRFFREIFKILLPDFEVQATSKTQDFPDYAFFPSKHALDDAHQEKGKKSFYTGAFAVGEVKRWNIELDKFGKDKHDKRRNPSFQIWLYLNETEPRWGILSNGRKWRLYYQDKPLDCYYEVDLVTLLEKGNIDEFRYFYYFFRREAFIPNEKGEIFLDRVIRESADYAKEIGDNLKENIYRAMKIISDGFLQWPQNNLDYTNEVNRMEVQKSTMRLLYRFLFLLYAEGKGLLNLSDKLYCESYSFQRLKKEIKEKKEGSRQEYYLPISTTLWGHLKDLFRLINQGSESFGIAHDQFYVPAYNGGLFNTEKNPHLDKWTIGDTYLADAIDLLARSKTKEGKAFVDYSTLEIRHLGSIYEGLLEYKLNIAEKNLVVKGTKKKEWVTLEDYNRGKKQKKTFEEFESFDRVKQGDIYLATDKGERKTTGSYYTPDYIVKYIVENTIGPVVHDKWEESKKNNTPLVEATLSTTVLDPAMGSGHFLVGAVEFLAARLLEAIQTDIETGFINDDGHYTPDWAKREVVSHCIYGVDINEMAVELGKLSLWLTTISKDKPLSFLDHRLKCGNSLIGADLADLPWHPDNIRPEKARLDIPKGFLKKLVYTVGEISAIDDDTLAHVKQKEKIFDKFKKTKEYDMIKTLVDVRTSIYFGNEIEQRVYGNYTGDAFWSSDSEWRDRRKKYFARKGRKMAEEKHFFHWELEYPEIFFEEGKMKENSGFDVVIGNPPYVRIHGIDKESKEFLSSNYYTPFMNYDLYVPFVERGLQIVKYKGKFGYILPNKFITTEYGQRLREVLLRNTNISALVNFGHNQVFPDVTTYTAIAILDHCQKRSFDYIEIERLDHQEELPLALAKAITSSNDVKYNTLSKEPWLLTSLLESKVLKKVETYSVSLKDYSKKIFVGIQTSADEVYILEDVKVKDLRLVGKSKSNDTTVEIENQIGRWVVSGENINRYSPIETSRTVIFPYLIDETGTSQLSSHKLSTEFPLAWDYLKAHEMGLRKREGRDLQDEEWFAYIYQKNMDKQHKRKIILAKIVSRLRATYDEGGDYCLLADLANGVILDDDDDAKYKYLLSILNSRLVNFAFTKRSSRYRGGYYSSTPKYLELLPIRKIIFRTSVDFKKEKHYCL